VKILVLNYEYPPIGGGGGIISKYLSEGLARLGNEVVVVTTFFKIKEQRVKFKDQKYFKYKYNEPRRGDILVANKDSENHFEPRRGDILLNADTVSGVNPLIGSVETGENLRVIRLRSSRKRSYQSNPLEMLSWMRVTKKFLRTWDETSSFDICMAHFALPGGEVGRWLKKRYNIPYVVISHGHDIPWVHPRQMFFFHLLAYFWIKKICTGSALNFVQTRMMKANINRFLGNKYSKKNVIIPNGADQSIFYPDHSKRPDKLRILFIGRLVIQKDPMTFLRAIRLMTKDITDFEVHILGDGNLRKKMEHFVRQNGLTDYVRFLGKVPEESMVAEYQSAHLMVAPSLNEGMSISALEALNCGVYLIATRASGFEDIITENVNGEFVSFRNPPKLAERICRFYKQDLNRSLQPEPPRLLPEAFCWDNICQRYHDTLSSLLK